MHYEKLLRTLLEDDVKTKDKTDTDDISFDQAQGGEVSSDRKGTSPSVKRPPGKRGTSINSTDVDPEVLRKGAEVYSAFDDNVSMSDVEDVPLPTPHADMITQVHNDVEVGTPKPTNPDNLPDAGRSTMARTDYDDVDGVNGLDLTWYPVRNLPGYQHPKIRGAFTPLFNEFLGMKLEDVDVATSIAGSSKDDVRKFAGFLLKNGTIIEEWDNLEAFDLPRELYNVGRSAVIDHDGQRYFIMVEQLGEGHEHFYIYWGPDQSDNNDVKRIR